jgi:sprouty-related EVH1 domain-containing protein
MPDVGGGHEYIIYGQRISDQTVIITLNPLVRIHTLPARCNFIDLGFYARFFLFQVILSCVINRDLQYYKVMPTFHHWRAGKQRNGLTFQTAADARAFDKGIIKAYDDLIDGKDT